MNTILSVPRSLIVLILVGLVHSIGLFWIRPEREAVERLDTEDSDPVTAQPPEISLKNSSKRFFSLNSLFPFFGSSSGQCTIGDCLASTQCSLKGGTERGTCAHGFGVCCVDQVSCGSTVTRNLTYLVNIGYPSTIMSISNCQYVIEKMNDNICQIRLDFNSFVLQGPSDTACNVDTFTVTGVAGENPNVICGVNTGQHMYLDLNSGRSSVRINIATMTEGFERNWNILVSQIPCNSPYRAPQGCLQYYTEYSGTVKSFNYQDTTGIQQLPNQKYTVCIASREGFCGVTYKSRNFSLTNDASASTKSPQTGDTLCIRDFLSILTVSKIGTVGDDRFCGNGFNDLTTFMKPFEIRIITDGMEEAVDVQNKGFYLTYLQQPC